MSRQTSLVNELFICMTRVLVGNPSLGPTLGHSLGHPLGPSLGHPLGPSLGHPLGSPLGPALGLSLGHSQIPMNCSFRLDYTSNPFYPLGYRHIIYRILILHISNLLLMVIQRLPQPPILAL